MKKRVILAFLSFACVILGGYVFARLWGDFRAYFGKYGNIGAVVELEPYKPIIKLYLYPLGTTARGCYGGIVK